MLFADLEKALNLLFMDDDLFDLINVKIEPPECYLRAPVICYHEPQVPPHKLHSSQAKYRAPVKKQWFTRRY